MRRACWKLVVLLAAAWPAGARGVDFTFVVWSDPHFRDACGEYRDDSAQDIVNLPGKAYPASIGGTVGPIGFILVTGDITDNTLFNQYSDNDGQINDDFITHINYWFSGMPVYEVTGNHDSYNEPGATLIRNAITARHGGTSYSFDYGGMHFIGLDGWTTSTEPFSTAGLAFLEAHIPTLNTAQAIIIFNHFTPRDPPHAQWDRVYNAIQGYNVVLMCQGHEHYPRLGTWRGFDYLVTSDCKFDHDNPGFSVLHVTDTELTAAAYDWSTNAWQTDVILRKPISGLGPWFSPEVVNPSFEDNGGSLAGWQIFRTDGKGPDNPPYSNSNPYDVRTAFGDHFAGKITNWGSMDFALGQIIEVANHDPVGTRVWWSLSAWVQMHCRSGGTPYPTNIHQRWEIGWNDDGSAPANAAQCDHYQVIADLDGTYTGNDAEDFFPLSASGAISGVTGLRYVAVRVRLFVDQAREWSLNNLDNVGFQASAVPPAPWIGLAPPSLQHTIWIRDSLPNDTFTVTNIGLGTLTYTINDDADWLAVLPEAGQSQGEADTIEVSYDAAKLNAGEHLATITVSSPEAGNSPRTLAVRVIVETVRPDFDGDADVDQADFGHLQACLTGSGATQLEPQCANADFNGDSDVDADDLHTLLDCKSPPGVPAQVTCAED